MNKVLAVVAAAAVALLGAGAARADADFTDPAGDAAGGPDLIEVGVANDAFTRLSFSIRIAGGKELQADGAILLAIDADRNPATGADGVEFLLFVDGERDAGLIAWDGTQWVDAPSATLKTYWWGDTILLALDRSELGNSSGFSFVVIAGTVTGEEFVPSDDSGGVWAYTSVAKTFGMATGPVVVVTKGGAKAGKPFVVGYVFGRTDSPEPATSPRTTCVATLAGKRIPARVVQDSETAVCRVTLPAKAKGKALKLTLTTTSGGKSATKTYTTKVR